ncbi:MAG: hypothetical protein IKT87_07365 [Bacteroidaceae bacterium]|nr:hypothetical protein [Bacteroidaceae bacterium]
MKKMKIKGVEYPCRVTMGAMVRFKRESGKDIREVDQQDVDLMLLFVWCCVKSACNADGVDFDLPFDRFVDMLEPEDFTEFFGEVQGETQKKTVNTPMK